MASRFITPNADVGSGISPSNGAQLFFSPTGVAFDVQTQDTYPTEADAIAKTNANANPVIANGEGVFPDIWINGSYKVVLKDKNDVQTGFGEADPVISTISNSDLSITKATIAAMTADVDLVAGQFINVEDYATGNNSGVLFFKTVAGAAPAPDGGSEIDHDTLNIHFVQNFPSQISVAQFGAVDNGADSAINDISIPAAFAFAGLQLVWFPKMTIGVYLVANSIVLDDAYRFDGDNIQIKAEVGFTGATVDVLPSGTSVLSSIIVFLAGTFDDVSGVRRFKAFVGSGVTLNCNEVTQRGLYIERMPDSYIACNAGGSVAGSGTIDIGPFCWGLHLDHNVVLDFTEEAIKIGAAANGILITCPVIWGNTKTGAKGINFKDNSNSNGIVINGGIIEKVGTGIFFGLQNGPIAINGVDFEVITTNAVRAVGDLTSPAGREIGPITLSNCYLASAGSKIYADNAIVKVEGCRLRAGVDFEAINFGIIYSEMNRFENAAPSIVAGSSVVLEESRAWTPVLWDDSLSSGEGQTTSAAVASYRIISNSEIEVKGRIALSSLGSLTGSNTARIGPLPLTSKNEASSHSAVTIGYAASLNLAAANGIAGYIGPNTSYINLTKFSSTGGSTNLTVAEVSASGDIMFSATYDYA